MMRMRHPFAIALVAVLLLIAAWWAVAAQAEASPTLAPASAVADCSAVCQGEGCRPFNLPPVTLSNGLIVYPTRACLCPAGDGTLQVQGEGDLLLPNLQTAEMSATLHAQFILSYPSNEVQCLQFSGDWPQGVPLGETGLLITGLQGQLVTGSEPTVCATGTIVSLAQMPDGSGPVLSGRGTLCFSLQEPYEATFQGTLLIAGTRTANVMVTLDQLWGLAGEAFYSGTWFSGPAYVHAWRESATQNGLSGSATLTCALRAGQFSPEGWPDWLPAIPASDLSVTTTAEISEFCLGCSGGACVSPTLGVWAGAALDLTLDAGIVETGTVAARFFVSTSGVLSATTNLERCATRSQAVTTPSGADWRDEVDIPFTVGSSLVVFVAEWQRGIVTVALVDPQGNVTNAASVLGRDDIVRVPTLQGEAYLVRNPQAGAWQMRLSILREDSGYTATLFCLNDAPSIAMNALTSTPEGYTISWMGGDPDSAATVSLCYDRDARGRDGRLIARCLPAAGSLLWNTTEVMTGTYYVYARIDDGRNLPVVAYSAAAVPVADTAAPAPPPAPTLEMGASGFTLSWPDSPEADVMGYQVYCGPTEGVYPLVFEATQVHRYALPVPPGAGLTHLAIRAYDEAGHLSSLSAEVQAGVVELPLVRGRD